MKPKNMILLVVAIGCGLGASYLTSQLLANREKTVPTIKLLVAKKRIAPFALIKDPEAMFTEKEFPENVAPKKAITAFADAKDKRTNKVLNEEEVLLVDDLADAKTEGLAVQISPGERAVAIKVNAEKSVAGFVLPGSRVDVVATVSGESSGKEAKIILQNMLVLAVDTKDSKDPDQRSIIGQTVTLSAKPEEAQRLALAQSLGELQLILRPFGDREVSPVKPTRAADLNAPPTAGSNDSKEEEAASARAAAPPVPVLPPVVQQAPPEEKAEEAAAPPPPEAPVRKTQTHVMIIQSGENTQKAVFTREEGESTWRNGQIGRVTDDALDAPPAKSGNGAAPPADPKAGRGNRPASPATKAGT
jgi:Flp pilus assembly protein CpaB